MNRQRFLPRLAVLCLPYLAGCQLAGEAPHPADTVRGSAYYLERLAMPEDSFLVVRLLRMNDRSPGPSVMKVVAEKRWQQVGNPPYYFELPVPPEFADSEKVHRLQIDLYWPNGERVFHALTEPLTSLADGDLELRLIRTPPPNNRDHLVTGGVVRHYQCGDIPVDAFYGHFGAYSSFSLNLPWTRLFLDVTDAASEGLYTGDDHAFHNRGDTALLTLPGSEPMECLPRANPSPWTVSKDVALRAVGNEPPWVLELGRGDTPSVRLTLDYGATKIALDAIEPLPEGEGYSGDTERGQLVVELQSDDCPDSMVGWTFSKSVRVSLGEQNLLGCGRRY